MSGPVSADQPVTGGADDDHEAVFEELAPREAHVGPMTVRRVLPRRQRRTVGAWCFVDVFGPELVDEAGGMDIGPHPHTGLHTVTYLTDGQILHHDSLGSEQVIRPGQVNLMTAGNGVAHAEEPTGHYRGTLAGVQLWVAQPEATRHGDAGFEHHAELPTVDLDGAEATVLVGELAGAASPARQDTPLVGADVRARAGRSTLPLASSYEHVVVVLGGPVRIDGRQLESGRSAYLGMHRDELALEAPEDARVLLLGGEPLGEEVLMWWNFVGRTREEITRAATEWAQEQERFGRVRSALPRIPAPALPW